jgi:hypothetical protein
LEVSESTTSLTGESRSDATDTDASVLANDPTFTSWLVWPVNTFRPVVTHFKDGSYSSSVTSRGACSRHGGIDHPL